MMGGGASQPGNVPEQGANLKQPAVREVHLDAALPRASWCAEALAPGGEGLRVLAMSILTDGNVVEEVELRGADWPRRAAALRHHSHVRSATVLCAGEDAGTVRVVHAGCPVSRAISETAILPRFPLRLTPGCERIVLHATAAEARSFARALAAEGRSASVESLRDARLGSRLTARQAEVLAHARRLGYYAVPRRISLTRLAKELGISKSTLCELLMTIESRLLAPPSDA